GRSIGYMIGIAAGLVLVMAIVATGISGLLLALPGARPVVIGLSAAYFGYLALRIATAPPLAEGGSVQRAPTFVGGTMLSLINPKGYAAMAALFSGFKLAPENLALDLASKTLVLLAIIVAVDLAWVTAGSAMTQHLRDPRMNRRVN